MEILELLIAYLEASEDIKACLDEIVGVSQEQSSDVRDLPLKTHP